MQQNELLDVEITPSNSLLKLSEKKPNTTKIPNASSLNESISHLGYDNLSAIADIVDNSFDEDAEAKNVYIHILKLKGSDKKDTKYEVMVADDGFGMDKSTLERALTPGGDGQKKSPNALGRFGMGLNTASSSFSNVLCVITKREDDEYYTGMTNKKWYEQGHVISSEKSSIEEIELFKKYIPNSSHGTIIYLTDLHRFSAGQIENRLIKHLGRIYRVFINRGKNIFVNNRQVLATDPLYRGRPEVQTFNEKLKVNIPFEGKIYKGEIEVEIADLEQASIAINAENQNKDTSDEDSFSATNSGFYLLRNDREISHGSFFGIGKIKTGDGYYNRIRGEIRFHGELDNLFTIEIKKKDITIIQPLREIIEREFAGYINKLKDKHKKNAATRRAEKNESAISHKDSENIINQKSKFLVDKVKIKRPIKDVVTLTDKNKKTIDLNSKEKHSTLNQTERLNKDIVEFQEVATHLTAVLWEPHLYPNGKIVIEWNTLHPFYTEYTSTTDNDRTKQLVDLLIYSLSNAELKFREDMSDESLSKREKDLITRMLENLRSSVTKNLRALLS